MPSFTFRSKPDTSKALISRPITHGNPSLQGFQGDTLLMRITKTPEPVSFQTPIPNAPRPMDVNGVRSLHNSDPKVTGSHEYPRRRAGSLDSLYSHSDYSNESVPSSTASTPGTLQNRAMCETSISAGTGQHYAMAAPSGQFAREANQAMVASVIPKRPAAIQSDDRQRMPCGASEVPASMISRTDALSRGLSRRYGPSSATPTSYLSRKQASQPISLGPQTSNRRQGYWLRLGTVKVNVKELKKQEHEAEKRNKRNQAELKRVQSKAAKQAEKEASKARKLAMK